MVTKIHRDALKSEASTLRLMLERSAERDPLGSLSLRKRLATIEREIASRDQERSNIASVALVFDGAPVRGSSAIEADFAAKAIREYQDLISKNIDVQAVRSRVALSDKSHGRLNITSLLHGSFGFVLEEDSDGQLGMFESSVSKAIRSASDLLKEVSAPDGEDFTEALNDLDAHVFQSLKRFVLTLHKAHSTLKVAEDNREIKLDTRGVQVAFERVSSSNVEEEDESIDGELLGLVPIQRRFDFRRLDDGEVLQGRVSPNLSAEYLRRLEGEGIAAGSRWRAVLRTRTVHHPDGRHSSVSRVMIDLVRL